ncbi:hypothetical protein PR048_004382 [Dryococelus australis]|uniref:Uncharacterized protein n=1 Tax=Dryococelus australis TaxID=614101 RepID=A0ABQ9I5A3_9NEOP|nr:hypothetical protein PR048_004382 [Dryococelus australis]
MEWMANGRHEMTLTEQLRRPSLSLMCQWVLDAWVMIPETLVEKSFKKCCISNLLDGTEDDWRSDDTNVDAGESYSNEHSCK